jgi:hypothetical protein
MADAGSAAARRGWKPAPLARPYLAVASRANPHTNTASQARPFKLDHLGDKAGEAQLALQKLAKFFLASFIVMSSKRVTARRTIPSSRARPPLSRSPL